MAENANNKLPLTEVLAGAWRYCSTHPKASGIFAVLNYIVCAGAFYSWKTIWFWPVLAAMYVLWGALFRYYFRRQPYVAAGPLFASMVPSSKILVLTVMVVTLLVVLPILPLFLPHMPPEFIDKYSYFLQTYMQEEDVVDALINVVITLLSPLILYRPVFAWISSLIGRSGLLKSAFEKTQGNYWELLLLAIIINLSMSVIFYGALKAGIEIWATMLPLSVLVMYYNIVLAQCYEFFFLEIEGR